jgi:hypothetical protein
MASEKVKSVILHGVPYVINDKNELFFYGSQPLLQIGTWNQATDTVTLLSDWQTKAEPFLHTYKEQLRIHTNDTLEKARALQIGS